MIIQCNACSTRYHYDESRFAGAPAKRIRCTKCATIFEIRNPAMTAPPPAGFQPEETSGFAAHMPGADDFNLDTTVMGSHRKRSAAAEPSPPAAAPPRSGTAESEKPPAAAPGAAGAGRRLRLPDWERLSLACIAGPEAGRIFEIDKPRMVLGRAGGNILLNDPECSRQHAAIEVSDEKVFLVDLGSTNGTYVSDKRIAQAELENRSEFDVGSTTLMLIRTRKE
ncbi:MAG: zinc-ribbon domain-containing protein [Thermoanaerobaculia bacterium]|nr:zinc-ribbon domain-containing protein [Thermoanaerobaculia bacterium]